MQCRDSRAVNESVGSATKQSAQKGNCVILLMWFWTVNLFLHFAWENWQITFYEGMAEVPHGEAVWVCTKAAFGDANIATLAYVVAARAARSWRWLNSPSKRVLGLYLLTGISVTVVFEFMAAEVWGRWNYSTRMPVLPLGTGALPLLQWVLIPLLSLATVKLIYRGHNCSAEDTNVREPVDH